MICPGCGLDMPDRPAAPVHRYFNVSPECWSVFNEVIAVEFNDPAIFTRAHQLTVDAYAVQHAGGPHPDKSVDLHLVDLYFVYECGVAPADVIGLLQQRLPVDEWPHFDPPKTWPRTIFDVALVLGDAERHVAAVRDWSSLVWRAWSPHHEAIARLASFVTKK